MHSSNSRSSVWAILPVKQFESAKRRLADVLFQSERQDLFRHMLNDGLVAIQNAESLRGLMVVTRDAEMKALAKRVGARVLVTKSDDGQSAAVSAAAQQLAAEGVRKIMTLPGDVPLMTAAEIDSLSESIGDAPSMSIVPNSDGTGSNSIACSPPCAIPFSFGVESYSRHVRAAHDRNVECRTLTFSGMALDIDVVSDLVDLLARETTSSAQHYLIDSGIRERLTSRGYMDKECRADESRQRASS